MTAIRKIRKIIKGRPTIDGAGVHLRRVFSEREVPLFDPFLLFDDFRSDNPEEYLKGFPWHPHRGIETITYVLAGDVEHGDSLGNKGIISSGDVQWMTAGSGIIHQEMPKGDEDGKMYGFQLWANLPAAEKMINPRYQDLSNEDIPELKLPDGTTIRIIAGEVDGVKGPLGKIIIDPEYIDVTVPANSEFRHPTKQGHTVFAYIIDGRGYFGGDENPLTPEAEERIDSDLPGDPIFENGTLVLFEDGDEITVFTGEDEVGFLLISGKPIGEPVAWGGSLVMNTEEELRVAFEEYQQGTFIKYRG
jgi:quercetin 2,3-dioxygenase